MARFEKQLRVLQKQQNNRKVVKEFCKRNINVKMEDSFVNVCESIASRGLES